MENKKIFLIVAAFLPIIYFMVPIQVHAENYQVGVDYAATNAYLDTNTFIGNYNDQNVRTTVLSQLQGMADAGASIISTRIWLNGPGNNLTAMMRNFPLSAQELQNIRQYAIDVSSTKNKNGQYLDLYLGFLWINCANYRTLPCGGGWDAYIVPKAKQTFDDFFAAIGNVIRPDGKKAVTLVYADGEVIVGTLDNGTAIKPNTDKFLTQIYPYFVADANKYGITPSLYFIIQAPESQIFNDTYTNATYPAMNGRPSLNYIYPTTEFMRIHDIPIPRRLDMSIYVDAATRSESELIRRVISDLKAVYPNNDFGVAETYYYQDTSKNRDLGQAFTNTYQTTGQPKFVTFWSGIAGNGPTDKFPGYPYDLVSFLPQTPPTPTTAQKPGDLNADGKVDIFDYNILVANFGKSGTNLTGDIDRNGKVDIFDYNSLVGNFGK